jgi:hypothetical protein
LTAVGAKVTGSRQLRFSSSRSSIEDFVMDRLYGCAGIAQDMFDTASQSAWRTISPPFIGVSEELL